MKNNNNITEIARARLSEFFNDSERHIINGLDNLVHSLTGAIFVLEQSAGSDSGQLATIKSIKQTIDSADQFKHDFIRLLSLANDKMISGIPDEYVNNQLSRIRNNINSEDQEMELLELLINKVNNQFQSPLNTLLDKFRNLTGTPDLTLKQIPVSPLQLILFLQNILTDFNMPYSARKMVYQLFDVEVLQKLKSLYENIVAIHSNSTIQVQEHNQNPEIKDINFKKILNSWKVEETGNHKADYRYVSVKQLRDAFDILYPRIQDKSQLALYSAEEFINALKTVIMKLSKIKNEPEIHPRDEHLFKIVEIIFVYIKNDSNIHPELKSNLLRLQKDIYRAVVNDINILADKENPVRKLMNKLSYIPDDFKDNDKFILRYVRKMAGIVTSIQNLSHYSAEAFQSLLQDYCDFISKQSKKLGLIRKRLKEKEVGKEKIIQTKLKVKKLMDRKMNGRYMPVFIQHLLIRDWQNALVLEMLRNSDDSDSVKTKISFINELLDAVEPRRKKVGLNDIKQLALQYGEGLSQVAFHQKELKEKEQRLFNLLVELHDLKKNSDSDQIQIIRHKLEDNNVMLIETSDNNGESNENRFIRKAKALKTGDWLEIKNKNNIKKRVKISWISPISGNILLVNESGIRIADKSVKQVAEGLKNKSIVELKALPLIDRVFMKVLKETKT